MAWAPTRSAARAASTPNTPRAMESGLNVLSTLAAMGRSGMKS